MYIYLQKVELSACFPQGFILLSLENSEESLPCSLHSPCMSLHPCPPSSTSLLRPTHPWKVGPPCYHQPLPPMRKSNVPSKGWASHTPQAPQHWGSHSFWASYCSSYSKAMGEMPSLFCPLCQALPHTRFIRPCLLEKPPVELLSSLMTQTGVHSTADQTTCCSLHISFSAGWLSANIFPLCTCPSVLSIACYLVWGSLHLFFEPQKKLML